METTEKKDKEIKKIHQDHGVDNWLLLFFLIYLGDYIYENYQSYGIIKSPIELIPTFIHFFGKNWWIFASIFVCYYTQIVVCYLIEKLLSIKILNETLGMGLHVFNSLFTLHASLFLFSYYDFNRVGAIAVASIPAHITFKTISYAFINQRLRHDHFKKDGVSSKSVPDYPSSITCLNVYKFMLCTGISNYTNSEIKIGRINYKALLSSVLRSIGILLLTAFIVYQYLIPETERAAECLREKNYTGLLRASLKIALPADAVWILFFHNYLMEFYFPLFDLLAGNENVTYGKDWWNSETTTVFWTKWNYQIHLWFKTLIFMPALRNGYSKQQASYMVSFASGLLHEYLVCLPCRTGYGLGMFGMLAQIPLAHASTWIAKNFGNRLGNLSVWLSLIIGETGIGIFMYYYYSTAFL